MEPSSLVLALSLTDLSYVWVRRNSALVDTTSKRGAGPGTRGNPGHLASARAHALLFHPRSLAKAPM